MFAVQDDVAARIVATVADSYGVLVHSIRAASGQKDDADLTPVEWQFQYFAYREQITPASYAALKSRLERAVERNDRQSDLWACLAQIYVDEYAFGFGGDATSLDRALAAARRAVELDRANQFALVALAQVHFFRQDLAAFGPGGRARDGPQPAQHRRRRDPGTADRAHGRVRARRRDRAARDGAQSQPRGLDAFRSPLGALPQGRVRAGPRVREPGGRARSLLALSRRGVGLRSPRPARRSRRPRSGICWRSIPSLRRTRARTSGPGTSRAASWSRSSKGCARRGSRFPRPTDRPTPRGGPGRSRQGRSCGAGTDSGPVRADEGFWVAVLPFKYGGADASLTALAEGLTEEIVTGLSRFSYLG